jgi:G:T-mismatch repair DNA endonuclease (very short patch repair protein)
LRSLGWRIAIVWECSFRLSDVERVAAKVEDWLQSETPTLSLPRVVRTRPAKA